MRKVLKPLITLVLFVAFSSLADANPISRLCEPALTEREVFLRLRAFETPDGMDRALDEFTGTNDRALGEIFSLLEKVEAYANGKPYKKARGLHGDLERLNASLAEMLGWLEHFTIVGSHAVTESQFETAKAKLAALQKELSSSISQLENIFKFNYADSSLVKEPLEKAKGVLSGRSKSKVTLETIETCEELVRYLHEIIADAFARHIYFEGEGGFYSMLKESKPKKQTLKISKSNALAYFGALESENALLASPMGKVVLTLREYFSSEQSSIGFKLLFLTDRSLSAQAVMGHHVMFLRVLYETKSDAYRIYWGMNEPGYGDGRIVYAAKVFPLLGFKHEVGHNHHQAFILAHASEIVERLQSALFVSENMSNLDMGSPRYKPEQFAYLFEGWFRKERLRLGKAERESFYPENAYLEALTKKTSWTANEKLWLKMLLADHYPLALEAKASLSNEELEFEGKTVKNIGFKPDLLLFFTAHLNEFYPETVSLKQAMGLFNEALVTFAATVPLYRKVLKEKDGDAFWEDELVPASEFHALAWQEAIARAFNGRIKLTLEYRLKRKIKIDDAIPVEVMKDSTGSLSEFLYEDGPRVMNFH